MNNARVKLGFVTAIKVMLDVQMHIPHLNAWAGPSDLLLIPTLC